MIIDPRIEEPTRTMLGQAIRGELGELDKMLDTLGEELYAMALAYCIMAASYIAIDLSGRWPTDTDIRTIAKHLSAVSDDYALREQDVYDYISRMALRGEMMNHVFPGGDVDIRLPVLITAQLLLSYRHPNDMDLWEYLDTIWNALNAAEHADMSLLPAMLIRQKRDQAAAKQQPR
jgi:hypothetical protein